MRTHINCKQDALWHALTDAETSAKFEFVETTCQRDGDSLVYRSPDGNVMMICTDIKLTPKSRIERTFEPHWAGPDVPLQASRTVYLIEVQGDHCQLTLEHYDLPADQIEGVTDGWQRSMSGLKTLLETGTPVRFADPAMGM